MNTNNVKPLPYNKDTCFSEMFENMYPLFLEYMKREDRFQWNKDEFDINISEDQMLLKTMLQINFVEELNEATMARENFDHYIEEIVDAFNFLVASYFIYGWNYSDLDNWKEDKFALKYGKNYVLEKGNSSINMVFYDVIEQVGRTCNLLKNYRSWKSCQYRTDIYQFNIEFKKIWKKFNNLCNFTGIDSKTLFEIWSCKYQINKFRMDSNY